MTDSGRVKGPLVRIRADKQGGRLYPRSRWLTWLFPDVEWSWSSVTRIDLPKGQPIPGWIRILLTPHSAPRADPGVPRPRDRFVSGFTVWLDHESAVAFLDLAPTSIPRDDTHHLYGW
jgi:hypothetical protein